VLVVQGIHLFVRIMHAGNGSIELIPLLPKYNRLRRAFSLIVNFMGVRGAVD